MILYRVVRRVTGEKHYPNDLHEVLYLTQAEASDAIGSRDRDKYEIKTVSETPCFLVFYWDGEDFSLASVCSSHKRAVKEMKDLPDGYIEVRALLS